MASNSQEDAAGWDVDEWDPSRGSFAQHAVAGSIAGMAEHSMMFPIDTIKTLMQTRPVGLAGGSSSAVVVVSQLWSVHGVARFWRGVQTMFTGCVPAHGAYFTIYETAKPALSRMLTTNSHRGNNALGSGQYGGALAAGGAVALGTVAHDVIMTPMDVCKQRLQLGLYHNRMFDCACAIMRQEGLRAFVLSYPTTLLMNMPYALVMGSVNESLRHAMHPDGAYTLSAYLLAGAGAGAAAAAFTNPLDVVKTRLQTQHLACMLPSAAAPPHESARACPSAPLVYRGLAHTVSAIWQQEGLRGFFRGIGPRMLIHAPSVAICWSTYETIKHTLERLQYF